MIKKLIVLLLCSIFLLTGCGKQPIQEDAPHELLKGESQSTDENSSSDSMVFDDEANRLEANTDSDLTELSEEFGDVREPEKIELCMNENNGNEKVSVTMKGLCQYETLESVAYTDTPKEGNVFVVMFLCIKNYDNGDDYINSEAISASVDGKEIQHCALFNEPESYMPIFEHISNGEELNGFVAWEVPAGWNKLHIEYKGWKETCGLIVSADVTPEMLCAPPSLD